MRVLLASVIAIGPAMPAFAVSLKDIPVVEPTNLHAFVKGRTDAAATPAERAEAAAAKEKLVVLGKALFWDMQVGTDDVQACASCHFNAGADPRPTNQLNPGGIAPNATADTLFGNSAQLGVPGANSAPWNFGFAANMRLLPGHFPLHLRENPTAPVVDEVAGTLRDTNDVVSSQGVRENDLPYPFNDGVFNSGGANQRRVEPRNAPTMINAVYSLDMFWDGRASFIFNGQNPFGFRDRDSMVKRNLGTAAAPNVQDVKVRIPFASHASQSVGPPLSHFEMAGTFRTFPELADKMLDPALGVMELQVVHPQDSVLGPYAKAGFLFGNTGELDDVAGMKDPATGADLTYLSLIQDTFREEWWNGGPAQVRENFALFFGLAMQAYQGTLIADDTPFDRFAGTTAAVREGGVAIAADPNALTQQELLGLDIFQGTNLSGQNEDPNAVPDPLEPNAPLPGLVNGGCINCHILPETTNHTVRLAGAIDPVTFAPIVAAGGPTDLVNVVVPGGLIEPMPMGAALPVDPAILAPFEDPLTPGTFNLPPEFFALNPGFLVGFGLYDVGFYNLGVRPTGEDLSRAGAGPATTGFPAGLPLSYTALADMVRDGLLDPVADADVTDFVPPIPAVANLVEVPLTTPLPNGQQVALINGIPTAGLNPVTRGAFKVPNLRNQEFQGPYFHTGGSATLRQVVEFYARGGDFPITNLAERDADIMPIPGLDVTAPPLPGSTVTAEERIQALVAFLAHGLTDERVANEAAPFDHPQLILPEGANGRVPGADRAFELKATGAAGAEVPIPRFLSMDPQATGDPELLGAITGRVVRDGTGEILAGITVSAHHEVNGVWEMAGVTFTDSNGLYHLGALVPGTYKIRFRDELGVYSAETYEDAPYALNAGTGTDVTVDPDTTVSNINASLGLLLTDAFEVDNTADAAKTADSDTVQQRTLEAGDVDWVKVPARVGNTYIFETSGDEPVDTYLEVFSPDGTRVGANNDGGAGAFSLLSYEATTDGALYFRVRGASPAVAGPYTLDISANDVTAPSTSSDAVAKYMAPGVIKLTAADDWSGVQSTMYRVDGGAWTQGTTITISDLGPHTVEFYSTDASGNQESVKTLNVAVADKTKLSTTVSVVSPKYNQRTTVTGTLRRGTTSGPGIAGEKLRVQSSTNGKTWKNTSVLITTNAQGVASASMLPRTTTYYRLRYEGKANWYEATNSNSVRVKPGVYLRHPSAPTFATRNRAFTSVGTIAPRHAVGSRQVLVKAYRWESGKWVPRKMFRATISNYKTYSKYTARVTLPAGKWRIRAHHPADSLNANTYSTYKYLTVR